jgi:hypothetical protein
MLEDIVLRNLGRKAAACTLTIRVEADFADLFEVKEGRIRSRGLHSLEHNHGELRLARRWQEQQRAVRITADDATVTPNLLTFRVVVPPRGRWQTTVHSNRSRPAGTASRSALARPRAPRRSPNGLPASIRRVAHSRRSVAAWTPPCPGSTRWQRVWSHRCPSTRVLTSASGPCTNPKPKR